MSDKLDNALADILIKTTETAEAAQGFILSEMPDVVNQLLWWQGVKSSIGFLFGVIVISIAAYLVRKLIAKWCAKEKKGWFWDYDGISIMGFSFHLLTAFLFIFGIILMSENIDWLQILIAPKIFLIEYAAGLVK